MDFEGKANKIERESKFNPNLEIGSFEDIKSSIVFCAISKKIDNTWGNEQDKGIAEEIKEQNIDFDENLIKQYQDIRLIAKDNQETLKWLAFVVEKDASAQSLVVEQMVKHKDFDKKQAELLLSNFSQFYFEAQSLIDFVRVERFISADIEKRKDRLSEIKKMVNEAIGFFKPDASKLQNVIYLPTNPLEKKQSGNGLSLGENFYINSELGNEINEVHEYLHSIINPITEKIELSPDDEEKILKLCPGKLKNYKYPLSILTEEIIRTYKTGFSGENKVNFDNFKKALLSKDESEIDDALVQEKARGESLAANAAELLNSDDLIKKYYEKYIQDGLSERVWSFFESYEASGEDFEKYCLENYRDILK